VTDGQTELRWLRRARKNDNDKEQNSAKQKIEKNDGNVKYAKALNTFR